MQSDKKTLSYSNYINKSSKMVVNKKKQRAQKMEDDSELAEENNQTSLALPVFETKSIKDKSDASSHYIVQTKGQ